MERPRHADASAFCPLLGVRPCGGRLLGLLRGVGRLLGLGRGAGRRRCSGGRLGRRLQLGDHVPGLVHALAVPGSKLAGAAKLSTQSDCGLSHKDACTCIVSVCIRTSEIVRRIRAMRTATASWNRGPSWPPISFELDPVRGRRRGDRRPPRQRTRGKGRQCRQHAYGFRPARGAASPARPCAPAALAPCRQRRPSRWRGTPGGRRNCHRDHNTQAMSSSRTLARAWSVAVVAPSMLWAAPGERRPRSTLAAATWRRRVRSEPPTIISRKDKPASEPAPAHLVVRRVRQRLHGRAPPPPCRTNTLRHDWPTTTSASHDP